MTQTIDGATVVGFNPIALKGDKGDTGAAGAAGATGATPNLTLGTVTSVPNGQASSASITGTAANPILNLVLQAGPTGGVTTVDGQSGALLLSGRSFSPPDLPGGWAGGVVGTRRANYLLSGGGVSSTGGNAYNDSHIRMPVLLPVTTTRWRLRIGNTKPDGSVANAGVISFTGAYVGVATVNSTGTPTGPFTAAPTQALGPFSSNSDGSDFISGWISNANQQFSARTLSLLSVGWTKAGGTAVITGAPSCFLGTGVGASAEAGIQTATIGVSTPSSTPFDIAIEYEFVGTQRVGLAVGDSITEGQSAGFYPNVWHQRYSQRAGTPMSSTASFGSSSATWSTSSTLPGWNKIRDAGLTIDYAVINLGVNDAGLSRTLSAYQTNIQTIITTILGLGIRDIYLVTISPRNAVGGGGPENARISYNGWIGGSEIAGVTSSFAFNEVLTDPAVSTALLALYDSGDHLHWSPAGHWRAATTIPQL